MLKNNGKHQALKTKFQGDLSCERLTNPAIGRQLLIERERWVWSIFKGPEAMPTGTGNDGSGRSQSTTQDDPLIPSQAKRGLNEMIGREGRNALFL